MEAFYLHRYSESSSSEGCSGVEPAQELCFPRSPLCLMTCTHNFSSAALAAHRHGLIPQHGVIHRLPPFPLTSNSSKAMRVTTSQWRQIPCGYYRPRPRALYCVFLDCCTFLMITPQICCVSDLPSSTITVTALSTTSPHFSDGSCISHGLHELPITAFSMR